MTHNLPLASGGMVRFLIDPQGGKRFSAATKTRIMADSVFWQALGEPVE